MNARGLRTSERIDCLAVRFPRLKHWFRIFLLLQSAIMQSSNECWEQWNWKLIFGCALKSIGQGKRLENQDKTGLACRVTNMTGCWFIWRRSISGGSTRLKCWNQLDRTQRRRRIRLEMALATVKSTSNLARKEYGTVVPMVGRPWTRKVYGAPVPMVGNLRTRREYGVTIPMVESPWTILGM